MSIVRPLGYFQSDFGKQLAATIVCAQIFAIYCLFLLLFDEPTESQISWADPFLKIMPIQISVWTTVLLSLALAACCLLWLKPRSLMVNIPFGQIGIGVFAAVVIAGVLRIMIGDSLPDFVPAEESSRHGFLFGMAAGYGEEVYFRMLLTPLTFVVMYKLLPDKPDRPRVLLAAATAIIITALAFALFHEWGEADGEIVWKLFATRFIVPGILMGSLYFVFGPGFVIFMHSTMHIMIPLLFN